MTAPYRILYTFIPPVGFSVGCTSGEVMIVGAGDSSLLKTGAVDGAAAGAGVCISGAGPNPGGVVSETSIVGAAESGTIRLEALRGVNIRLGL